MGELFLDEPELQTCFILESRKTYLFTENTKNDVSLCNWIKLSNVSTRHEEWFFDFFTLTSEPHFMRVGGVVDMQCILVVLLDNNTCTIWEHEDFV